MPNRTTAEDDNNIYEFIKRWHGEWGLAYGPSFRDVSKGAGDGIPLGTVYRRCVAMREIGRIHFWDHVARSLKINDFYVEV